MTEEELKHFIEEALPARRPPRWRADMNYKWERFAIRSGRIATGIGMIWIALGLGNYALDSLSRPFAALSPLALFGGVLAGIGSLALIWCGFVVAFGKGESRAIWDEKKEEELRNQIRSMVGK